MTLKKILATDFGLFEFLGPRTSDFSIFLGSGLRTSGPPSPRALLYRADGVRIAHDPHAAGMREKYGAPGATDEEGFDDP
jgi:hypothetical protein